MKKYTEQVFENRHSDVTVGDLKKIIENLDDNMKIGGIGHFGEYLETFDIRTADVYVKRHTNQKEKILAIVIEDPGEEPD